MHPHDGDYGIDKIGGACCANYPHPKMAPGQTPYTCLELVKLYDLVADAAEDDPGEDWEEYYEPA